jgi:hypothetical protein
MLGESAFEGRDVEESGRRRAQVVDRSRTGPRRQSERLERAGPEHTSGLRVSKRLETGRVGARRSAGTPFVCVDPSKGRGTSDGVCSLEGGSPEERNAAFPAEVP